MTVTPDKSRKSPSEVATNPGSFRRASGAIAASTKLSRPERCDANVLNVSSKKSEQGMKSTSAESSKIFAASLHLPAGSRLRDPTMR